MPSGVKAGLIGAAVGLVLGLLGLIPALGCCFNLAALLVYVVAGVLAGFWMPPIRSVGAAAGQGAIAGVISGIGGSIVATASALIYGLTGGTSQAMAALDPTMLQQLADLGIDPETMAFFTGVGGSILGGAMCCVGSLAIGAALGALGGAVFAAAKKD